MHLLDRADHRPVVLQNRLDERVQIRPARHLVVECVPLHLALEVRLREVEAVLMPVPALDLPVEKPLKQKKQVWCPPISIS